MVVVVVAVVVVAAAAVAVVVVVAVVEKESCCPASGLQCQLLSWTRPCQRLACTGNWTVQSVTV